MTWANQNAKSSIGNQQADRDVIMEENKSTDSIELIEEKYVEIKHETDTFII